MQGIISHCTREIRNHLGSRFFRRIHHFTQRMTIEVKKPTQKSILLFSPHVDDETLGAGGTLLHFAEQRSKIKIIWLTTPENDSNYAKTRQREAIQLADRLGATYDFWDYPDGKLSLYENKMASKVSQLLSTCKPDIVFTPHPVDQHKDHQAAASGVAAGIRKARFRGEIWAYEVWAAMWPNAAVRIDDVLTQKEQLIQIFQSQIKSVDYVDGILGLNRYRGLQIFSPAAESFFVTSTSRYCLLCNELFKI